MQTKWAPRTSGFTIVELLIVIVVIAILAAITIVAYSQISARARDAERKDELTTLAKVTHLYNVDKGDYVQAGCGMVAVGAEGSGWLNSDYDGAGTAVTINDCLINNKNLARPLIDPAGTQSCSGTTCHAYMKVSCASGTWYLANLEMDPQSTTFTDDKCQPSWDTTYGMNYAVRVN